MSRRALFLNDVRETHKVRADDLPCRVVADKPEEVMRDPRLWTTQESFDVAYVGRALALATPQRSASGTLGYLIEVDGRTLPVPEEHKDREFVLVEMVDLTVSRVVTVLETDTRTAREAEAKSDACLCPPSAHDGEPHPDCVHHTPTPDMAAALKLLLRMHPRQRARVFCWFCDVCSKYVPPGTSCFHADEGDLTVDENGDFPIVDGRPKLLAEVEKRILQRKVPR